MNESFKEAVVIDYFKDPLADIENNQTKIDEYISGGLSKELLLACPSGTIIGRVIGETRMTLKIYLPFFSHISLPIKSSEHVWVFEEENEKIGYWLSRKIGFAVSEDKNYTVEERIRFPSTSTTTFSKSFPNVREFDMEKSRKESIARNDFKGEPVPEFKIPSHATALQGSNNTLVLLSHNGSTAAGQVDIIAGRGADSVTAPAPVVENYDGYSEVDKGPFNGGKRNPTEGNLSPTDLSRIIASMKFNPDSYFSIDIVPEVGGAGPAVVLKSDQVRIVAKKDFKIQVGEGENASGIIIKSNGDIIILPSAQGIVKIGGEDATGAILASKTGINIAGKVTSAPIASTSGGLIGLEGTIGPFSGNGIFATKILVKID